MILTASGPQRIRFSALGSRLSARFSHLAALLSLLLCLLAPSIAGAENRILKLTPDSGPVIGGTVVRISLEELAILGDLEVRFGNRLAAKVRRLGKSTLEVMTPPGNPGPVEVRVVNDFWGTATSPAVFTYLAVGTPRPVAATPEVIRVEPATLPVGSGDVRVQLEGQNLSAASQVLVRDTAVPSEVVGPGRLQATLPAALLAGAGTLEIRVTDSAPGGRASASVLLAVENPAPRIVGFELLLPSQGGSSGTLLVRGNGFRPESVIQVADAPVKTTYRSGEELIGTVPPHVFETPATLAITVSTPSPGGGASNPGRLLVEVPPVVGRYIVFTSNRNGGRNHLFLYDRATTRLDPLDEANNPTANDAYPSISADGRFIVFQSDRHRGQSDIFLFDRQTRTLDLLPEANHPTAFDGFPKISPDGRSVVFESDRLHGRPKIFLFDRQTRTVSELSHANEATADDGLAAISN
jgi:hypothetical protein